MIQLNPQYEAIFDARNIDEDCNKIANEINDVARMQIQEILAVGMYKQAVTLYLQLLKAASKREQCQVLLEHCRAGADSTGGQVDGESLCG